MSPEATSRLDILLAEDDPDDRFLLVRALRQARPGLAIGTASDGVDLMRLLHRCAPGQEPRLLLLDLNMPRLDGREVLVQLRQDCALSKIPVVVLTTSTGLEDRDFAQRQLAREFISKPDDYGKTVAVLGQVLHRHLSAAAGAGT